MIICPGGAYVYKAYHEGAPVAQWLNSIGISAFVLDYRTQPYQFPCPLLDVQRAIRLIRYHSGEWGIDPDRIGLLGFSAGGHLTAMASTHFDEGNPDAEDKIDRMSCRPDIQILCYPAISFMNWNNNTLTGELTDELRITLSGERNVRDNTPPAFMWITRTDEMVSYRPLFDYANALYDHAVPFELHIFNEGRHGLGMAEEFPVIGQWVNLCSKWLEIMEFYNKE